MEIVAERNCHIDVLPFHELYCKPGQRYSLRRLPAFKPGTWDQGDTENRIKDA